ncbi:MAG TPA: DNA-processing protein DprA [Candidatus Saccharimonadales bacterium]|nr:DNA-processing protein DprA [Candidatus Saccharimonadales bacterium]
MTERSYWLGFSSFSGIGPGKFALLIKEFGTAEKAWNASFAELEKVLGKALTPQFVEFRDKFVISDYEKRLKRAGVSYLILTDKDYPRLLAEIKKPPFVLYYKGNKDLVIARSETTKQSIKKIATLPTVTRNDMTIAIVGTRRITEYGRQVTESLTTDLVNSGFVIVSGLALGVDATAHKTTIVNKGKTIAVLGCGVNCCYPRENQQVYDKILESGGAIVSEYPLSQEPSKGSFPSRNRIISGLSQGVIVTEGAADSGALYTAKDAFENGRPVFAVPGPITSSLSQGPHGLIAKGAKLISGAEDIIKDLGFKIKDLRSDEPFSPTHRGASKEEQRIIDILQNESMHFDELVKRTKIPSSKLGSILSLMEMRGIIRGLGSGNFSINNS